MQYPLKLKKDPQNLQINDQQYMMLWTLSCMKYVTIDDLVNVLANVLKTWHTWHMEIGFLSISFTCLFYEHMESRTNMPSFCKWHFHLYFLEWKLLWFPEGPLSSLVKVMAFHPTSGMQLFEPMKLQFTDAYIRLYGSHPQVNRVATTENHVI